MSSILPNRKGPVYDARAVAMFDERQIWGKLDALQRIRGPEYLFSQPLWLNQGTCVAEQKKLSKAHPATIHRFTKR